MNEIISSLESNTPLFNEPYFGFHVPDTYWAAVYC